MMRGIASSLLSSNRIWYFTIPSNLIVSFSYYENLFEQNNKFQMYTQT